MPRSTVARVSARHIVLPHLGINCRTNRPHFLACRYVCGLLRTRKHPQPAQLDIMVGATRGERGQRYGRGCGYAAQGITKTSFLARCSSC